MWIARERAEEIRMPNGSLPFYLLIKYKLPLVINWTGIAIFDQVCKCISNHTHTGTEPDDGLLTGKTFMKF